MTGKTRLKNRLKELEMKKRNKINENKYFVANNPKELTKLLGLEHEGA